MGSFSRAGRLVLLSGLYFSQGLPLAFFTQALPLLMRDRGIDLRAIGLTTLLGVPWGLKFLVGPWVDRRASRRRLLLALQLATIAGLLVLALLEPSGSFVPALSIVFVVNLLSAGQDVVTDGLAVSVLAANERGAGNAVQVGAHRAGMVVGGGILLTTWTTLGWNGTFVAMAAMLALASLPALLWRESSPVGRPHVRIDMRDWLSRPGALAWFAVLIACKAGDALASGMLRPFLEDLGLEIGEVGELLGLLGFTLGLAGAALGGWLADRIGRRTTLVAATAVEAVALALFVPVALGAPLEVLWLVSAFEAFATGIVTAAVFTIMMDASRPAQGATDFTVQASVLVLGPGLFGAASGFVAHPLGYPAHFAIASLVAFAGVVLIARHRGPAPFDLRGEMRP